MMMRIKIPIERTCTSCSKQFRRNGNKLLSICSTQDQNNKEKSLTNNTNWIGETTNFLFRRPRFLSIRGVDGHGFLLLSWWSISSRFSTANKNGAIEEFTFNLPMKMTDNEIRNTIFSFSAIDVKTWQTNSTRQNTTHTATQPFKKCAFQLKNSTRSYDF